MAKQWTKIDEIEACLLRWLGRSVKEIAYVLGRTPRAVNNRLFNLGMSVRHAERERKESNFAAVRAAYAKGLNDVKAAKVIGISCVVVGRYRKALGLPPLRTRSNSSRRGVA